MEQLHAGRGTAKSGLRQYQRASLRRQPVTKNDDFFMPTLASLYQARSRTARFVLLFLAPSEHSASSFHPRCLGYKR